MDPAAAAAADILFLCKNMMRTKYIQGLLRSVCFGALEPCRQMCCTKSRLNRLTYSKYVYILIKKCTRKVPKYSENQSVWSKFHNSVIWPLLGITPT